jgi:organic radical activating enzyme
MKYPIVEIFSSIQGEGFYMGKACTFIRFAGCNLNCEWCDTNHSEFTEMDIDEILSQIKNPMVVITGGEPTLHDLKPLLEALKKSHHYVAIETNGTFPVKRTYGYLISWIACSPKPDNNYDIIDGCTPNELKYVVDENFTVDVIPTEYHHVIPIWLQPEGFNMQNSASKAFRMVITTLI